MYKWNMLQLIKILIFLYIFELDGNALFLWNYVIMLIIFRFYFYWGPCYSILYIKVASYMNKLHVFIIWFGLGWSLV